MFFRYTKVYIIAVCLCTGVLLLGALIVDPYGISPIRLSIEGFNQIKQSRNGIDELIKPFDVLRFDGDAIFIGSSRIKRGLDPEAIQKKYGLSIYNLGVDGQKISQSGKYIRFAADNSDGSVLLFVEAYDYLIDKFANRKSSRESPDAALDLKQLLSNAAELTLSRSALMAQLETMRDNAAKAMGYHPLSFTELNGYYNRGLPGDIGLGFECWARFVWLDHNLSGVKASRTIAQTLIALRAIAQERGITVEFVLTPFHPVVLYGYEMYNVWPEIEAIKRQLAEVGGVYDFMRYNEITDEPLRADMKYWRDTNHFQAVMGEKIVQRLMNLPGADTLPENFGLLLTPATIETDLEAFRAERDAWAKANPEIIEYYRKSWSHYRRRRSG